MHADTLVSDVIGVEEQIDATLVSERLLSILATLFATLAVGLAAIGLVGVVSYSVARRRTAGAPLNRGSNGWPAPRYANTARVRRRFPVWTCGYSKARRATSSSGAKRPGASIAIAKRSVTACCIAMPKPTDATPGDSPAPAKRSEAALWENA